MGRSPGGAFVGRAAVGLKWRFVGTVARSRGFLRPSSARPTSAPRGHLTALPSSPATCCPPPVACAGFGLARVPASAAGGGDGVRAVVHLRSSVGLCSHSRYAAIRACQSGCPAIRARQSGCPAIRARQSGCPAIRARQSGCPAIRARQSGYPAIRARQSGYPATRACQSGYAATRACQSGFPAIRAWELAYGP